MQIKSIQLPKELREDMYNELTLEDFASSFGTTIDDIDDDCRKLIAESDFRYRIPEGKEHDNIILDVLKKIDSDQQIVGAKERSDVWEKGWAENLKEFIDSDYDLNKLVPKFIRPSQIIRLNQNYAIPADPNFELDYFSVFRLWIFKKYLKDFDAIYDFGCGTGFNLTVLGKLFPEKRLYGLDFVPSSRDLVNKLGQVCCWNLTGHTFDMRLPDENLKIADNSAILTNGAIEQLAGDFEAFLQFLLKRSPALCIHVEPTIELYDEDNLVDYLAVKFHRKRGYTQGFLPRLQQLRDQGKIEIIKIKRLFFGSLFMEGYNLIIWKPDKTD
ncbi:MAG: class I SAM-dependent methyltransferase [Phycisphaerales bacterium]|jgi:hypothetical protein